MRVKLFSVAAATPIQSLEDDINEFLELRGRTSPMSA